MAVIRTVTGDIAPADLGITYCHEHLLWQVPAPLATDPDLGLDDASAAETELGYFYLAGGRALVEMTTPELARAPQPLRALSERTGVHIIAATGYNKGKFSDPVVAPLTVEEIAHRMIADIETGMDTTDVRAGALKVSCSKEQATPGERKVIRAAGIAHQATGAPVSTHTEAGTYALEQLRLLQQAGVEPDCVLVGHLDRKLDLAYHLEIASTGAYLGFDQIGKEKYAPDSQRIDLIARLVDAGYGGQIVLSGDMARKSSWPSYGWGYGPGLIYILRVFVPRLLQQGLSQDAVKKLLIDNPRNVLTFHTV